MSGRSEDPGRVSVAAVVTAFNSDERLVRVCESIRNQVDLVVIVDDGSPTPDERVLASCRELGALVVRHSANLGIGAALNTGVDAVRADSRGGASADVLTLDQDSTVPDGYVRALRSAERRAVDAGVRVAMVGPDRVAGVRPAAGRTREGVVYGREPIQSGLLVLAAALDELGSFAAELFIDGVDTEFFLRARTRGLQAVVAPGVGLVHELGQRHVLRAGSKRIEIVHAAPFRYYFIARNRLLLIRRYGRSAPGWAAAAVLRDLRHLILVTALVPGRRPRLMALRAGLADGWRGVTGPRPA